VYRNRWRLFFGILFIVLGGVWLWNNLDLGPQIPIGSLWPILLILLGLYIIMRQTVWARQSAGAPIIIDRILGDLRIGGPQWNAQDRDIFTLIGDVDIDLRGSAIPEGETTLHVRSLIGDIDVMAPAGVGVFASVSALIGDLRVLGKRRDGFFQDLTLSTPDYATATRRIRIEIDMLIGDAEIERVA
jgi:lia operon protein LiaF